MSSQPVNKNGKAPLITKGKNVAEFYMGAPKSDFDVPQGCVDELRSKNLAYRWIDIQTLKKNGNMHRQGWAPYKFKCLSGATKDNPFMDSSLDGYLVMKGNVLAVKTSEAFEASRQFVRRRTAAQSNAGKQAEQAFTEFAKGEKAMKVHGWDDSDEKET